MLRSSPLGSIHPVGGRPGHSSNYSFFRRSFKVLVIGVENRSRRGSARAITRHQSAGSSDLRSGGGEPGDYGAGARSLRDWTRCGAVAALPPAACMSTMRSTPAVPPPRNASNIHKGDAIAVPSRQSSRRGARVKTDATRDRGRVPCVRSNAGLDHRAGRSERRRRAPRGREPGHLRGPASCRRAPHATKLESVRGRPTQMGTNCPSRQRFLRKFACCRHDGHDEHARIAADQEGRDEPPSRNHVIPPFALLLRSHSQQEACPAMAPTPR